LSKNFIHDRFPNDKILPLHQSPSSQSEFTKQVAGQVVGRVILEEWAGITSILWPGYCQAIAKLSKFDISFIIAYHNYQ
jgi:hypothetical protein